MVVHIMNNEIGCFNQFVLREQYCGASDNDGNNVIVFRHSVVEWPSVNVLPNFSRSINGDTKINSCFRMQFYGHFKDK